MSGEGIREAKQVERGRGNTEILEEVKKETEKQRKKE